MQQEQKPEQISEQKINILEVLNKLLNFKGFTLKNVKSDRGQIRYNNILKSRQEQFPLTKSEIIQLLEIVKQIHIEQGHSPESHIQKEQIEQNSIILPFGDIHGDFEMFKYMLFQSQKELYLDDKLQICNPNIKLVFMGDYIDNGYHQVAVLSLVLLLKIINPNNVYLIKGNHEIPETYYRYGFIDELREIYSENWTQVKDVAASLFDRLPSLLYLQTPDTKRLHFSHGSAPATYLWKTVKSWIENPESPNCLSIQTEQCEWGEWSGSSHDCSCRTVNTKYGIESSNEYRQLLNIVSINCGHQDVEYGFKQIVQGIHGPICVAPILYHGKLTSLMEIHKLKIFTLEELQEGHNLSENMYGDTRCPITISNICAAPKLCYDACIPIINTGTQRVKYIIFRIPFFFDLLHIEKQHSENISDYYKDKISLDKIDISKITDDIMRKILTRSIYNTPYTINYDGTIKFHCVEEIKELLLIEEEKQIYMLLLQYYGKI